VLRDDGVTELTEVETVGREKAQIDRAIWL
jgi:hypothetical protein